MKVVVLVSGGLDSVTALHVAAAEHEVVAGLSFDYGSKHNDCEIPFAKLHCERFGIDHVVIELPFMDQHFSSDLLQSGGEIPEGHYEDETMRQTVVPFRNGILLAIAAGFAESRGAEGLVIAAHSGDHAIYPDCRETFMEPMAEAIEAGTYETVKVLRPFIDQRKEDIVTIGTRLGINYAETWSCYKGGEIHCGRCGTCVERREAFEIAGIVDPTVYL
ncbi:MAG: 7-cyano-7-deazaguanine synthase QueC [Verrucomicrobiota bacterium]